MADGKFTWTRSPDLKSLAICALILCALCAAFSSFFGLAIVVGLVSGIAGFCLFAYGFTGAQAIPPKPRYGASTVAGVAFYFLLSLGLGNMKLNGPSSSPTAQPTPSPSAPSAPSGAVTGEIEAAVEKEVAADGGPKKFKLMVAGGTVESIEMVPGVWELSPTKYVKFAKAIGPMNQYGTRQEAELHITYEWKASIKKAELVDVRVKNSKFTK
jgi:hypothetical protein